MNDLNFFVLKGGRGKGVLERSLEWKLQKCSEGVEEGDEDGKSVYTYFGKRIHKVYLVCSLIRLSLKQIIR